MKNHDLFLLLGGNIGDKVANLEKAADAVKVHIGDIVKKSSLYRTAAWGNENQPDFLNQVLQVKTLLSPAEVLHCIKHIETEIGRIVRTKWAEREIDMDILLWGDRVIFSPELTVPHPFLHKRRFALMPLNEITAELQHPVLKKSIADLLMECDDLLPVTPLLFYEV